ncbi:MAG TPA: hypothetical protein VKB69_11965 [Micromonosporaceae bacterium]|nr:hypothetical protein [Micromonosporaceae bacterium]
MMDHDGTYAKMLDALLASPEPSVRWKVRAGVLGEAPDCAGIVALRAEIRDSEPVRRLLAPFSSDRRPAAYAKWQGAHWALAALADLGYPSAEAALHPLREQVLDTWLGASYYTEFEATSKSGAYRRRGVAVMQGRYRRCASQQGNALWSVITLGLADRRCDDLVERLLHWQWPDGGWNCDKNPDADTSSFCETLLPMRGLAAYASTVDGATGSEARDAARHAAEVLLTRGLAYRVSTGEVISPEFVKLHYPLYWHYDVLGGLKGVAQLGLLGDERCARALDLLESMRLPDGWPAHNRYYRTAADIGLHNDCVDWGGTGARRANPWVTADALAVLHAAGRVRL